MGDLLIATFPAKKSILTAGTHVGMAATSVLEPIVLLYRFTGDSRYLDFARYLVKAWDEPGGPKIIATLLTEKKVNKTANGKAYEMLSNLVGLCELARATGDRSLLEPVTKRLERYRRKPPLHHRQRQRGRAFPGRPCPAHTGRRQHLRDLRHDHLDPAQPAAPAAHGRYEVSPMSWRRSFYNHLAAAQHPRGDDWCYYTALEGKKPYDPGINCCHSSGPRGMALAVQAAYLKLKPVITSTLWLTRSKIPALRRS